MESVIQQLLARDARLIILCNEGDDTMAQFASQGCMIIQVRGAVGLLGWMMTTGGDFWVQPCC